MNTSKPFLLIALLCLYFISDTSAQATYRLGGISTINLHHKLKSNWSYNTKFDSRQLIQNGDFKGVSESEFQYLSTDLSLISARKILLNSRVAGGYLIRLREGEFFHRFIQQFTVVQKITGYRIAHRFVSDQTFSSAASPTFRLRYRVCSEIPLHGEGVDANEFYLKFNNEYLNIWRNAVYDLEVRLVPLLGYDIGGNKKIEAGLDYRVDSWLKGDARHNFWMTVNFFIEI